MKKQSKKFFILSILLMNTFLSKNSIYKQSDFPFHVFCDIEFDIEKYSL